MVMMMAGTRLVLQRTERLLRVADISGLQGLTDLVQCLRERAIGIFLDTAGRLRLSEGRIGLLRPGKVAGLDRLYELSECLPCAVLLSWLIGCGGIGDGSNAHEVPHRIRQIRERPASSPPLVYSRMVNKS